MCPCSMCLELAYTLYTSRLTCLIRLCKYLNSLHSLLLLFIIHIAFPPPPVHHSCLCGATLLDIFYRQVSPYRNVHIYILTPSTIDKCIIVLYFPVGRCHTSFVRGYAYPWYIYMMLLLVCCMQLRQLPPSPTMFVCLLFCVLCR